MSSNKLVVIDCSAIVKQILNNILVHVIGAGIPVIKILRPFNHRVMRPEAWNTVIVRDRLRLEDCLANPLVIYGIVAIAGDAAGSPFIEPVDIISICGQ